MGFLFFTSSIIGQPVLILTDGPVENYGILLQEVERELKGTSLRGFLDKAEIFDERIRSGGMEQKINPDNYDLILAVGPASSHIADDINRSTPEILVSFLYDPVVNKPCPARTVMVDLNLEGEAALFPADFIQSSPPRVASDSALLPWLPEDYRSGVLSISSDDPLPGEVRNRAIQLLPLWHLPESEQKEIYNRLSGEGIAVLAVDGTESLDKGAFVSYKKDLWKRLGREISLHIEELMNGGDDQSSVVTFPAHLTINPAVFSSLGLEIPWDTLIRADFTEFTEQSSGLDLKQAVADALESSSDYRISLLDSRIQSQTVRSSRSALLPDLSFYLKGTAIDEDRADSSLTPREFEASLGFKAQQVLWSDEAWTNYRIQKLLDRSQNSLTEQQKQNAIGEAAQNYYKLSRALAAVQVQKDAVSRTSSYLERARLLEKIGEESSLSVYRMENQLAVDRKSLIDAFRQARAAMLELYLSRGIKPDEMRFSLENLPDVNSVSCLESGIEEILNEVNTSAESAVFEEFILVSAISNSSILLAQDFQVEAFSEDSRLKKRSFFSPTVVLSGNWEYGFFQGGAGSGSEVTLAPGISFDSSALNSSDDTDWSAGISLSLPLYSGNQRVAEMKKSDARLEQARIARQSLSDTLEMQVRIQVSTLLSSYAKLGEARIASEAGAKVLEYTEDAYEQGTVTSYELLDARNSYTLTSIAVLDQKSEFRLSLVGLMQVMGHGEALVSEPDALAFLEDLENTLK